MALEIQNTFRFLFRHKTSRFSATFIIASAKMPQQFTTLGIFAPFVS